MKTKYFTVVVFSASSIIIPSEKAAV